MAEPAPPPPAPPRVERPVLHAGWSFQTSPDACVASAAAGRIRLVLSVGPDGPLRLTVSLTSPVAGNPVAQFRGPAGRWSIQGRSAGRREIAFALPRDMLSLSRVLMLLSGGALDLQAPDSRLPILDLAASGPDGQRWFDCARGLVI